jgi:hypothetical protein
MRSLRTLSPWRRSKLLSRARLVLAGLLLALAAATALTGPSTSGPTQQPQPVGGRVSLSALARSVAGPAAVAVPIRLADPAVGSIVRPGDRVDVVAVDDAGAALVVAHAAPVLAVPGIPDNTTQQGAILVVAIAEADAPTVLSAALRAQLAVSLRPP